jgi:peptidoglycan/xylan/chitin deacetylase (PgdA/CDA1 family)
LREQQAVAALVAAGVEKAPFLDFWPRGHAFAFVVTHDVETKEGLDRVLELARVDARHGLVSSFNLIPERYRVDPALRLELEGMGCEIGVHGLRHDGLLFSSRRVFEGRAARINAVLRDWGSVGFRAPLTHRQPYWMQTLDVEYDASFFDTDPFEPMPGGTGSIWPYFCGHFVELPYTLPQDSTLYDLLDCSGLDVWIRKLDFIEHHGGMGLINVHPDYVFGRGRMSAYESLLNAARERGCWNARPKDVVAWWRRRARLGAGDLEAEPCSDARTSVALLVDHGSGFNDSRRNHGDQHLELDLTHTCHLPESRPGA